MYCYAAFPSLLATKHTPKLEVLDEIYTICSVTRYAAEPYGRILQGSEQNWLHGQSNKNTGVLCAGQETEKKHQKKAGNVPPPKWPFKRF